MEEGVLWLRSATPFPPDTFVCVWQCQEVAVGAQQRAQPWGLHCMACYHWQCLAHIHIWSWLPAFFVLCGRRGGVLPCPPSGPCSFSIALCSVLLLLVALLHGFYMPCSAISTHEAGMKGLLGERHFCGCLLYVQPSSTIGHASQ